MAVCWVGDLGGMLKQELCRSPRGLFFSPQHASNSDASPHNGNNPLFQQGCVQPQGYGLVAPTESWPFAVSGDEGHNFTFPTRLSPSFGFFFFLFLPVEVLIALHFED